MSSKPKRNIYDMAMDLLNLIFVMRNTNDRGLIPSLRQLYNEIEFSGGLGFLRSLGSFLPSLKGSRKNKMNIKSFAKNVIDKKDDKVKFDIIKDELVDEFRGVMRGGLKKKERENKKRKGVVDEFNNDPRSFNNANNANMANGTLSRPPPIEKTMSSSNTSGSPSETTESSRSSGPSQGHQRRIATNHNFNNNDNSGNDNNNNNNVLTDVVSNLPGNSTGLTQVLVNTNQLAPGSRGTHATVIPSSVFSPETRENLTGVNITADSGTFNRGTRSASVPVISPEAVEDRERSLSATRNPTFDHGRIEREYNQFRELESKSIEQVIARLREKLNDPKKIKEHKAIREFLTHITDTTTYDNLNSEGRRLLVVVQTPTGTTEHAWERHLAITRSQAIDAIKRRNSLGPDQKEGGPNEQGSPEDQPASFGNNSDSKASLGSSSNPMTINDFDDDAKDIIDGLPPQQQNNITQVLAQSGDPGTLGRLSNYIKKVGKSQLIGGAVSLGSFGLATLWSALKETEVGKSATKIGETISTSIFGEKPKEEEEIKVETKSNLRSEFGVAGPDRLPQKTEEDEMLESQEFTLFDYIKSKSDNPLVRGNMFNEHIQGSGPYIAEDPGKRKALIIPITQQLIDKLTPHQYRTDKAPKQLMRNWGNSMYGTNKLIKQGRDNEVGSDPVENLGIYHNPAQLRSGKIKFNVSPDSMDM